MVWRCEVEEGQGRWGKRVKGWRGSRRGGEAEGVEEQRGRGGGGADHRSRFPLRDALAMRSKHAAQRLLGRIVSSE